MSNKQFIEGQEAILHCEATGIPVPRITWYFNGNKLNLSSISSSRFNFVSNSWIISEVMPYNVGTYTCVATNIAGSAASSGIVTVNGNYIYK